MSTTGKRDPSWVRDGEKFALVGLSVQVDPALDRFDMPGGLTALVNAEFELPDHWREWLGTLRVEDVEECTLFILAKMRSGSPGVDGEEDEVLRERVGHLYLGLIHGTKFFQHEDAFRASGGRENGTIDVSHFQALIPPHKSLVDNYPAIAKADLTRAAQIGARLGAFSGPWQEHHWRLSRCRDIYQTARCDRDMLNRIHQFTRCIEGLIAPTKGETTAQFKHRTELFVGPRHHPLMGEIYEVRSHIEHLHEYRYLARRDRATRIRLAELEAISEAIARDCLARILLDPALMGHFGGVDALNAFWAKPEAERRAIWGAPVDPLAPLAGFRFDHVSDEELGARP